MKAEVCHVLFPGGFKPIHAGHIALMEKYLESDAYDVDLTVIISKSPREGITAETSKWFLEEVFKNSKYKTRVHIMIAPDASPIKTVYDMTGTKQFGPGIYAMGTSAKGDDIKRAEDYTDKFAPGGKYETPGVKTIFFPINPEPLFYKGRGGMHADLPISSTIVRQDIRDNNYEQFKGAYDGIMIPEEIIKEYFLRLSKEVLPIKNDKLNSSLTENLSNEFNINLAINEGGNAGHMQHPYEVEEFTIGDLKNLIIDLFAGKVTDVTEKLDGQNLWASVDNHGNTIFSRNTTTLTQQPWYLEDIMNNPKWTGNPSVQHAFSNGALTIDKVFKNIPHAVDFFNYDDKTDSLRYRTWVNLEIIDTQNFNVIPYVESKVSFHNFKIVCFDYSESMSDTGKPDYSIFDDTQQEEHMKILQTAINKTNNTTFKAQITPELIFKKLEDGEKKAAKYIEKLEELVDEYMLNDEDSITAYKEYGLLNYLAKKFPWLVENRNEALGYLINRWVYNEKGNILELKNKTLANKELISKEQYALIRDFEKNELKEVFKKIMRPIDSIFIQVGNEVLKRVEGLSNAGHESEVIKKLNKEINTIKLAVNNSNDPILKSKLEKSLKRLADVNNELNATEGIVFTYKGKTMKLTGSFAPLNQMLGLSKYNR